MMPVLARSSQRIAMSTLVSTSTRPASHAVGVTYALLAYGAWGLLPLYWHAVAQVPSTQVVAHRILWSVLVLLVLISGFKRWPTLFATLSNRRQLRTLLLTAGLISVNW